MKRLLSAALLIVVAACTQPKENKTVESRSDTTMKTADTSEVASDCSPECEAKGNTRELTCKLTTPEMRERKATVLASLKKQIVSKKELSNGYAFQFKGTDALIDELAEFVKTERQCCDFFTFNLSFGEKDSAAWLEIKGPDGAKEFITDELGL